MKRHALGLAAVFVISALPAAAQQVRVDAVRYCRTFWPICNGRTQTDYHWWDDYHVADDKQRRTYIARYSDPPRSSVQHLVFISDGQRFGDGNSSLLTGADDDFGDHFGDQTSSRTLTPMDGNLPQALLASAEFPAAHTFMAAAWDARYNWGFTPENKRDIVNAYYAWLKSKFVRASLRSIYLAGHSRGGALVFALASRFNRDYPEIPLILHIFDGVANRGQQELGSGSVLLDNPLTDEWQFFADEIDFVNPFPNWNIRIFNQVSGDPVINFDPIEYVRGFGAAGGDFDIGWMRQAWSLNLHSWFPDLWGSGDPLDLAWNDLMATHPPMVAARIATQPPTAVCSATATWTQPGDSYVGATFDGSFSFSNSGAPLQSWNWSFFSQTTGAQLGTADSAGPIAMVFYANDICWSEGFIGQLTVRDANGNEAQAWCGTSYLGCNQADPTQYPWCSYYCP